MHQLAFGKSSLYRFFIVSSFYKRVVQRPHEQDHQILQILDRWRCVISHSICNSLIVKTLSKFVISHLYIGVSFSVPRGGSWEERLFLDRILVFDIIVENGLGRIGRFFHGQLRCSPTYTTLPHLLYIFVIWINNPPNLPWERKNQVIH